VRNRTIEGFLAGKKDRSVVPMLLARRKLDHVTWEEPQSYQSVEAALDGPCAGHRCTIKSAIDRRDANYPPAKTCEPEYLEAEKFKRTSLLFPIV
jgi:hypothetical protein